MSKTYTGSITLVTVEDGNNGAPGPQGATGAPGEPGRGIDDTKIEYGVSESSTVEPTKWEKELKDLNIIAGQYLWTRTTIFYSDGDTVTSFSVARQGEDGTANKYRIETNTEKINKVYDSSDIKFSPSTLKFYVYKDNEILDANDYTYTISVQCGENFNGKEFSDINDELKNIENLPIGDYLKISENNSIEFNIGGLCKFDNSNNSTIELLKEILKRPSLIIFNACEKDNTDSVLVSKVVVCENVLSNSLASFSLTATGIQAAVDNKLLDFSADGLVVTGTGITIKEPDEGNITGETLFSYDATANSLYVKGSGEFTGKIIADSGEFRGNIYAEAGTIGGFDIDEDYLYSSRNFRYEEEKEFDFEDNLIYYEKIENDYVETKDGYLNREKEYYVKTNEGYDLVTQALLKNNKIYYTKETNDDNEEVYKIYDDNGGTVSIENSYYYPTSSLMLRGKDGIIIAEDIELGSGAKIKDEIILGNNAAFIFNPDLHEGVFLQSREGNISLNSINEILKIGELTLNGKDSIITGEKFKITPYRAEFSNVNVSGKIMTSVFETNHTSVVGGSMIFKDAVLVESYICENDNGKFKFTLTLERESDLLKKTLSPEGTNRYIACIYTDGSIDDKYFKDYELNGNEIILTRIDEKPIKSIVVLGSEGSAVISINSEDSNTDLFAPRGLSMKEIIEGAGIKLRTFLGDLSTIEGSHTGSGYGLYSDNVILNGSLITLDNNNISAGISTTHDVYVNSGDANTRIVLWAGAAGTKKEEIQNAAFKVTQEGSVYANKGNFSGIISDSTIRGSDIYAARLHGYDNIKEQVAALTIYDTKEGIVFKSVYQEEEKEKEVETLKISNDGFFFMQNKNFIAFENNTENKTEGLTEGMTISFNGEKGSFGSVVTSLIQLDKSQIKKDSNGLSISNDNISVKIADNTITFGDNTNIFLASSLSLLEANTNTQFHNNMKLGDNDNNMEYKRTTNGYDLYIYKSY